MKKAKERLIDNWKTTIIGLIILAVCIYCLVSDKMSGEVFAAIMPVVLLLFRVKDTALWFRDQSDRNYRNRFDGTSIVMIPLLFIMMASSCTTYQRCQEKFGNSKPPVAYIHDTIVNEIIRPADSNTAHVNLGSLKNNVVYKKEPDSGSNIAIEYSYDSVNNTMTMKASTPADTIHDTTIINDTIPCSDPGFEEPTTKWDKVADTYQVISEWGFPIFFVLSILFIILLMKRSK
jgi:hypothetical protein